MLGQAARAPRRRWLAEIVVPGADGEERLGRGQADRLVCLFLQGGAGVGRGDRHGGDNPGGPVRPHGGDGRPHARPGGQAVIDEDDGAVAEVGRGASAAVGFLAALEFPLFGGDDAVDLVLGDQRPADDRLVDDPHPARRNRAHRQLFVAGDAQLAHQEDVERRPERPGHLEADGHAPARQRQDDPVPAASQVEEGLGQPPAGVDSISEASDHGLLFPH